MVPIVEERCLPGPEPKADIPVLGFCTLMGEKLAHLSKLKSPFSNGAEEELEVVCGYQILNSFFPSQKNLSSN